MTNNTISLPDFESLEINPKTVAYSCLELDVAELIGSIRWDAASILGWRMRSSAYIAHEILMRMGGEFSPLELKMGNFARALRNDISYDAGARWLGRLVRALDEDQKESGFYMVNIDSRRKDKYDDGTFYNLPTLYTSAEFPSLFYHVQMTAIKCDLCNLDKKERRARQRSIIESWLTARGCVKIIREKIEKEKSEKSQKEKSASPPCRCDCASCVHCAAKSATASEANGAGREERITDQTIGAKIDTAMEIIFGSGQDWMNTNRSLPDWVRKIHARFEIEELRLRDAMKRANKSGLRLVGGQPK